jgi:CubicO group peptidase (beta-lactamase class C family)
MPELNGLHPKITIHHLLSHTSGLFDIYAVPNLRLAASKLVHEDGDFLGYLGNQEPVGFVGKY